jgi:hypothetical protein
MNGGTESSGSIPEEQKKKITMLKNEHNSSLETTPTPQWNEVLGEGEDVGWGNGKWPTRVA